MHSWPSSRERRRRRGEEFEGRVLRLVQHRRHNSQTPRRGEKGRSVAHRRHYHSKASLFSLSIHPTLYRYTTACLFFTGREGKKKIERKKHRYSALGHPPSDAKHLCRKFRERGKSIPPPLSSFFFFTTAVTQELWCFFLSLSSFFGCWMGGGLLSAFFCFGFSLFIIIMWRFPRAFSPPVFFFSFLSFPSIFLLLLLLQRPSLLLLLETTVLVTRNG